MKNLASVLLEKRKKKGNPKGFSLVELLIVIAIMGVLAVIAFNAFNGVLLNSKRRADEQQAKNIEKAIRVLITDTGIVDITASGKFYVENGTSIPTNGGTGVTGGTGHQYASTEQGLKDLIADLQGKIYVQDPITKIVRAYGPYLDNPTGSTSSTYDSYAPQWNSESGGKHTGYLVLIRKSNNIVNVIPVMGASTDALSPSLDEKSRPGISVQN